MQALNGAEIAVIGMAGRFPGAEDIDAYWRLVEEGIETIRPLNREELTEAGIGEERLKDPDYVNAGAFLEDIEYFDAGLFGYSAREAELMDPQHRLFLETAWQALEHAGCAPDQYEGAIGVFAGSSVSSYLVETVRNPDALRRVVLADLMYENNHDLLATRLSYKLNLTGPSVVLGTACSTSLVLIHYACQSLLAGDCDTALAGGVRVSVPHKTGYVHAEGGILSGDGHCATFDASASGTISSNGVGVVVLKRLADAIRDGDTIHAIVKGTAVNNDGAQKVGFTSPSVAGQVDVIKKALVAADVQADSIGYVEAHGTATRLGDPMEVAALTRAYRAFTGRRGFCAIGSVKANIGHTDCAAGVAGFIKVVQMLRHAVLPPSVRFRAPNPEIDFADSPFFVSTRHRAWEGEVRRAAVSAFGIGGTNAHAILESVEPQLGKTASRSWQVLCFSGKTRAALTANLARFRDWLSANDTVSLADAAYTLQTGRIGLDYRCSVVSRDREDMLAALAQEPVVQHCRKNDRGVVFLFSGQGAQYPDMMRGLYESEPAYAAVVDECAALLAPELGVDIRDIVFPSEDAVAAGDLPLYRTRFTQPALFVVEYALARLLMSWGVRPRAAIGHSIGEYVAACLAGVFDLPSALALVSARAAAMEAMPSGRMIAVGLSEAAVKPWLRDGVCLAAVNAPERVTLSGESGAIGTLEAELERADIVVTPLHTSHAFHSSMMDGCLETFSRAFDGIELHAPMLPFLSCVSGDWIRPEEAVSVDYWLRQLRMPVRFADGVARVTGDESHVLLEVGPGRSLATLAEESAGEEKTADVLFCVREMKRHTADDAFLYGTIGKLWSLGVKIDWRAFHRNEPRRKIPLPTYSFQRQRYWLDRPAAPDRHSAPLPSGARLPMADWFYRPVWRQATRPAPASLQAKHTWLVLCDGLGVGRQLSQALRAAGHSVWQVWPGRTFRVVGDRRVQIPYGNATAIGQLFAFLHAQGALPDRIADCLGVTPFPRKNARARGTHFEVLLAIARAFTQTAPDASADLFLVCTHRYDVTGSDRIDPAKALPGGACRVIPREFAQIRCKEIDIALPARSRFVPARFFDISPLVAELLCGDGDSSVALRGRGRYVQSMEAVSLDEPAPVPLFREQGVYVITGGFGGIGATVARHLARNYQARLILIARGDVPPEAEWDAWLAEHDASNEKSRRIRLLRELHAMGGRALAIASDLSDIHALKRALVRAERVFGTVNGVFHSAGVADGALIQRRTAADSAAVFTPKVGGSEALAHALRRHTLDCFVLCSSLASHIAPLGQAAYCAANAFQDAFAHRGAAAGKTRYLSIGWDSWREVGMAVDSLGADRLDAIRHGLLPEEGIAVLERTLASGLAHCVVSTRGLPLPSEEERPEPSTETADTEAPSGRFYHPRPDLPSGFLAPRDEIESCIQRIWQDKMGVAPLGIDDDFFELNGHSLMAVQIVAEIKRQLDVRLPTGLIFDNPTIAKLADCARSRLGKTGVGDARATSEVKL
ncbi:type I polyketide synthase [Paludibacterium paludis]|uniref:Polyketide synthase n=1 Tax=Paludibacterium paludis TaxID=1225769 RepID=A0A918P2I0_9NEIS|nr:type I polyketide synthase [Paludibacterium paludis]GGY14782.1 polyketide synthase [Paludibacterium paludis]